MYFCIGLSGKYVYVGCFLCYICCLNCCYDFGWNCYVFILDVMVGVYY